MAPKPKIYFTKADYEKDHGKGALARPAATKAAGGKAVTGAGSSSQPLKQPQPSALARERVAPYSTRQRRQRQAEEEKEQLAPSGYEPVRGGKRKKARGGMGGAAGGMEFDAGFAPMMMAYPPVQQQSKQSMTGQGPGQGQGGKGKASTALATAQAIINSAAPHPKKGEIVQLVQAHLKGWVPPKNFQESLAKLLL